ncbi:2-amino-4-hydroxy-6-hydroxymethyldihydropteridine diphosphokinase [Reinekea thalattae]|uniref:2-amino-4-hydroxy-6-hydroxymethyldihydropteridine diphosphokinase n=1 Tax=Reinekea thalattae TaxID=2593301 RepID=A0A5C8Z912_9GAMM|nr:2-amino-4-hydroxy-6-hydroxymethyldihydropteridine diphosphokinase [Reinekea thalattae]TXR54177.1 2-amino-4-hydroxy-6-hydroxymethyldihydropteridine diphosphokinase [Reinekea thalattae]
MNQIEILAFESKRVALSLGSNMRRYFHLNAGLNALRAEFGALHCSPVYESAAVGFDGSPFLNMAVVIETDLSLPELIHILKAIEDANGRDRSGPKFSPRTLDIDVVTYGDECGVIDGIELPRPELFFNAFVTKPLADLIPQQQVPGRQQSFAELWHNEGNRSQALHRVEFQFTDLEQPA